MKKNFFIFIFFLPFFLIEVFLYKFFKKKNSEFAYQYLIKVFILFGRKPLNFISYIISERIKNKSILKKQKKSEIVFQKLNKDGYYLENNFLTKKEISKIKKFIENVKGFYQSSQFSSKRSENLNLRNIKGPRFQFDTNEIIKCKTIQSIISKKNILHIAKEYLQCEPILDYVACYWSFPNKKDDDGAAQAWHFDLDRPKWIKFFIYLTDCNINDGPHIFIRSSHLNLPYDIKRKGYKRIDKQLIKKHYKKKDIITFLSNSGSLLIEDSIGIHKGLRVISGKRLMLSLQYSSSLFGSKSQKIQFPKNMSYNFKKFIRSNKTLFSNFTTS